METMNFHYKSHVSKNNDLRWRRLFGVTSGIAVSHFRMIPHALEILVALITSANWTLVLALFYQPLTEMILD